MAIKSNGRNTRFDFSDKTDAEVKDMLARAAAMVREGGGRLNARVKMMKSIARELARRGV